MTDPRQSGARPLDDAAPEGVGIDCAAVELWLAESAEQTLPSAVADRVRVHAAGCAACEEKLAQARSGREWLLALKQEPLEPPAGLVAKILARTSLAGANADQDRSEPDFINDGGVKPGVGKGGFLGKKRASGDVVPPGLESDYVPAEDASSVSVPAWQRSSVVVLRRTLLDPRLALVAAMAFFSISLTLNMMGFRLTGLRAADLAPGNMHRTVVRQYAQASASVVRYYENLRIVYEMEARVQQLRRAAETSSPSQQQAKPRKQSSDSTGNSSNSPEGPHRGILADNPFSRVSKHTIPDPKPIMAGPRMDAAVRVPLAKATAEDTLATSFVSPTLQPAPLALSCPHRTVCFSMRYFSTRERRLA